MSRNYKFHNRDGVYFVSFAAVEWIDVFIATRQESCGSEDNLYLYPNNNVFELSRVYYRAHTHPNNNEPSPKDLLNSRLFGFQGRVYCWNGKKYTYGGLNYWN